MKPKTNLDTLIDKHIGLARALQWGVAVESFRRHLRKASHEPDVKKRIEYLDIAREKYGRAKEVFKRIRNPKKNPKVLGKLGRELEIAEIKYMISPLSYLKF